MTILRIAAVLAMIGLAFMIWAVMAPTVMPVMLAMSVGQAIGTLSFLLYLLVVATDLRRARVLHPPPAEEPPR
jgi:peptidoglycan/LPS O-acetylase OafA/YrhL